MQKNLFLDDIRVPVDAFVYTNQTFFIDREWYIVRDYGQFVAWIEQNGLPDFVSFDHDLADSHYVPPQYWGDYEANRAYQDSLTHTEKTGYECAKWLVDYCVSHSLSCPEFFCHSMNPVGRDRINNLLNSFRYGTRFSDR